MRRWEFVLQDKYEQDRNRLLDYREVELEFREWLINLLYEEVKKYEPGEHGANDGPVRDDRICDRECVRTEQNQEPDPKSDYADVKWAQVCTEPERDLEGELAQMIAAEPVTEFAVETEEEHDIYESYYEEIDAYKCQNKARPKKKHFKRK